MICFWCNLICTKCKIQWNRSILGLSAYCRIKFIKLIELKDLFSDDLDSGTCRTHYCTCVCVCICISYSCIVYNKCVILSCATAYIIWNPNKWTNSIQSSEQKGYHKTYQQTILFIIIARQILRQFINSPPNNVEQFTVNVWIWVWAWA